MRGKTNDGLAWEERGDSRAPSLLLVRPLGGSMDLWGAFFDRLAEDFRTIAFDARGTGASPGSPRTSIEALASDARSVLDAREIERAHVFGISLGGMVAMQLAISSPSRTRGLVLASTTARGLAFERAGLLRGLGFARCLAHEPHRAERCLVRRVLSHRFRDEHPNEVDRIAEVAARTPAPRTTILAHALAALRHDVRAELKHVRARTLVLVGDRDHLLGSEASIDVAREIPSCTREVVRDAGHDLTLEQPLATAARTSRFLRSE